MVDNDLMVVLKGGKNPVLAHLFLQHMLDTKQRAGELRLHRLPAAAALARARHARRPAASCPTNLRQRGRARGVLRRSATACSSSPSTTTPRGTRSGRRSRPAADRPQPAAPAGGRTRLSPAGHCCRCPGIALAVAVLPGAALRRPRDRLRRGRPDLPHRPSRCGTRCTGTPRSSTTSSTASSARTAIFGPGAAAHAWSTSRSRACSAWPIAFPVAVLHVARLAGRRKGLILALLIAPFWISYMMRMLAWVNLLQNDGLVNQALSLGGLFDVHVDWLSGPGRRRSSSAWSTATCRT